MLRAIGEASCRRLACLAVNAVDVQAPNVETGEQVAQRIRAHRWLAPEQTIITSSCGFNHLPRHIALGKLRAMTEAKMILTGRVQV
jgi:5-methyltetrahydropteroyltriglutamate--homocysteine methyltransferase